jgi:hypothetical protein
LNFDIRRNFSINQHFSIVNINSIMSGGYGGGFGGGGGGRSYGGSGGGGGRYGGGGGGGYGGGGAGYGGGGQQGGGGGWGNDGGGYGGGGRQQRERGPPMSDADKADRAARSVFVGNISYKASEDDLTNLFSQAGQVLSFRLISDRETGRSKGYGFCEFSDAAGANQASQTLNGYELHGRELRVDKSKGA